MTLPRKILSIIRLTKDALSQVESDIAKLEKFGYTGLEFEIPQIRVVARVLKEETQFASRPLLLNYGFVRLPIKYAQDPLALAGIREVSSVILSFFYRKRDDIALEVKLAKEDGLDVIPIWVEAIKEDELVLLNAEARKVEVKNTTDDLEEGGFLVLKQYPFEGLGAKILKKKANGKVQIEILSSSLVIWIDGKNLTYSDLTIYEPINEV